MNEQSSCSGKTCGSCSRSARRAPCRGQHADSSLSHATVFRRLDGIERRLGVSLFVRGRRGYTPTPAGEDMAATAARIEHEVLGAERRLVGRDLHLSGTLRVTTTDTLLPGLLAPRYWPPFGRMHPDIQLEVAVSNQLYSLTRRDADVAVRRPRRRRRRCWSGGASVGSPRPCMARATVMPTSVSGWT